MVYWLATSGVVGLVTWRLTRRATLAVIGYTVAFLYLKIIATEPAHPQEMVVLLLALTAAIATWVDPERPEKIAAGLGMAAAGLIMIKINVGIFAVVSLVSALMLSVQGRFARAASAALVVAAVLLPFAIIRHFLTVTWGLSFALVVASTFASSSLVASIARDLPGSPGSHPRGVLLGRRRNGDIPHPARAGKGYHAPRNDQRIADHAGPPVQCLHYSRVVY